MVSTQKRRKNKRSYIFLALSTLIVLIGGMLTLLWQTEQKENSKASASYIIGAPTLTAATVNQIFARVGSPMAGTGEIVEQEARSTNIDDTFALAVWWTETNDGAAGVGRADRNPGSVKGSAGYPVAFDGYTIYPSYAVAIGDWFALLRNRYVNRGLTSVYTICYPYVGTSGAASWANKVVNLMLRYHSGTSITSAPIAASPPMTKPVMDNGTNNIPAAVVKVPTRQKSINPGEHRPQISQAQHRPVTVGEGQVVIAGGGHTTPNMPRPSSATIQRQTNGIFTTHVQQLLIVLALLAAILVILPLPCMRIRRWWRGRMVTEEERITERLISFPPLHINEYSPLAEVRERMMKETGLSESNKGIPMTPFLRGMGTVPLTPFVTGRESKGGHGGGNDTLLRRARLVPVEPPEPRGPEVATEAMGVIRLQTIKTQAEKGRVESLRQWKSEELKKLGQKQLTK